jgi:hypothetical protein
MAEAARGTRTSSAAVGSAPSVQPTVILSPSVKRFYASSDEMQGFDPRRTKMLSIRDFGQSAVAPAIYAAFPGASSQGVARHAIGLLQSPETRCFHQILFGPADDGVTAAVAHQLAQRRSHFVADVDGPLAAHELEDPVAAGEAVVNEVLSAIDTCLSFQQRPGIDAHRVMVLDGQRRDKHSYHVYVFFSAESACGFSAAASMKQFAAEVNQCLRRPLLDLNIYRPLGSIRLPFAYKSVSQHERAQTIAAVAHGGADSDKSPAASIRRFVPFAARGAELARRIAWCNDLTEVDIIAAALDVSFAASDKEQERTDLTAFFKDEDKVTYAYDASDARSTRPREDLFREALDMVRQLPDETAVGYQSWWRVGTLLRYFTLDLKEGDVMIAQAHAAFDNFSRRCPDKYSPRTVANIFFKTSVPRGKVVTELPALAHNGLRKLLRDAQGTGNGSAQAYRSPTASVDSDAALRAANKVPQTTFEEASKAADEWTL